jgi:hypothetical protein
MLECLMSPFVKRGQCAVFPRKIASIDMFHDYSSRVNL